MEVRRDKTFEFAKKAHAGQYRKGTTIPYITHPVGVLEIAKRYTEDEDILDACLLHDTVEDTDTTLDDLRAEFGDKVAEIVAGVSEQKEVEDWKTRKDLYIAQLRKDATQSAIVSAADKMRNLRDIFNDQLSGGDKFWGRFSVDKEQEHWFYAEVLNVLVERGDVPVGMLQEMAQSIKDIWSPSC